MNINQHVRSRVVTSRDEGSGMVGVGGDCGRQGAANDFRIVELRTAGIGAGDEDSTDRITSPVREPTFAGLEKSGILMQKRWKNRSHHEVFDGSIRKGGGIAFPIAFPALAIAGFTVLRLADARQNSIPGKLDLIEGASSHNFEFLARRERRHFAGILQGQEIRQRKEEPVVRRSG